MKLNLVNAGTGYSWFKLGIQTFFRQPLALTGLFFMYMASATLLSVLPLVGPALALLLVPAFTLGLMAAAREADAGRFPMPATLFTAFRHGSNRTRAMLGLGGVYAALSLGVTLLAALLLPPPTGEAGPQLLDDPRFRSHLLLMLALYAPVALLFWHAPALVHWHGTPPAKSLFFSIVACLRNLPAYLVYGACWLGLFLAAGLFISFIATMMGSRQIAGVAMLPAALMFAAMFFASLYFTFRDSFSADGGTPSSTPPAPGD